MKIKLKGYNQPSASGSGSASGPQLPPHLSAGPPASSQGQSPASRETAALGRNGQGGGYNNGDSDMLEERMQGDDQDAADGGSFSPSSSSQESEDFVNAPIPAVDSSGDEYTAPNVYVPRGGGRGRGRKKQFGSLSPRPNRRDSVRNRRGDGGDDPMEFMELPMVKKRKPREPAADGAPRKRGRPPKIKDKDPTFSVRLWNTNANKGKARASEELESGDEEGDGDDDDIGDDSREGSAGPKKIDGRKKRGFGGAMIDGSVRNIKGKPYYFKSDELQLPIDEAGEKKIDELGNLLGGREWKAPTIALTTRSRPNRLFFLAIDAARCAGFRDSLYFFRRNPLIQKLNCTQEEKETLINAGRLHVNLRSRQVAMITASNCFKIFGARFVKNGKNVTDDYYEAAALAKGPVPGTPAFVESYDPEIDNTTLAMPKVGNFAAPRGQGRPAYMKIAQAFEMAGATPTAADWDEELEPLPIPKRALKAKEPAPDESSSEDDGKGGRRKKKGWKFRKDKNSPFFVLAVPNTYSPALFGTIGGEAGPQFGGNGLPPFGEQWEKSKARKPAPHMNGRNWMIEYAKVTRERNTAYIGLSKAYSAYHAISLGKVLENEIEEEKAGIWALSEDEAEYETLQEYKQREGLASGDEDIREPDDRKRGRSPSPSRALAVKAAQAKDKLVKSEDIDAMDTGEMTKQSPSSLNAASAEQPDKKQRRRRSPVRGFYDQHTRLPQIRTDTQPTRTLSFEQVDYVPKLDTENSKASLQSAAAEGIVSVEYLLGTGSPA